MKNRVVIYLISIVFFMQFAFFIQKLYFLAPREYSSFWSYPAKLAIELALQNKNKFDYIFLSDRIDNVEFAYPVYAKIDPTVVINQNKSKYGFMNHSFKKFDNIYVGFIADQEIEYFLKQINGPALFIGQNNLNSSLKTLQN